jgi:AbrB family looped-hinge helix DNA binding protein
MTIAIVSEKGWIVVPKLFREKYGLKPGSRVQVVDYGDGISIIPLPDDPITALRGMFAQEPSLTHDLLLERQRDRTVEEDKLDKRYNYYWRS